MIDIEDQMNHWLTAFSKGNEDKIGALYDKQACLWGTFSPIKRDTPQLITDYFRKLFQNKERSVTFTQVDIRFFEQTAISHGYYTFCWQKNNEKVSVNARFTFVYIKKASTWLIAEHHSSVVPTIN